MGSATLLGLTVFTVIVFALSCKRIIKTESAELNSSDNNKNS